MTLDQWISSKGLTRRGVAADLGVSPACVTRWCSGERRPGPGHALAIERLTGGFVPAKGWGIAAADDDASTAVRFLADWILQRGLTVTEAARDLGFPPMTFRTWFEGRIPSKANLDRLSDAVGVQLARSDFQRKPNAANDRNLSGRGAGGEGATALR